MPRMTRARALKIRETADVYLKKQAEDEKDEYRKLALGYQNNNSVLSGISDKLKSDKTPEQLTAAIREMKDELTNTLRETRTNIEPISKAFDSLSQVLLTKKDFSDKNIVDALANLGKKLKTPSKAKDRTDELIKAISDIKVTAPEMEFPDSIAISNFPPTKTPQPVTNININPLRGFIHTDAVSVSSSLTKIPDYGELINRRSVQFYNNSSTVTVFIGGSTVTSSNGTPVPPLSYSPVIDASDKMLLYGVTSSSTANIRVMEISNDAIGT